MGFLLPIINPRLEIEPMALLPLLRRKDAAAYLQLSPKTLETDVSRNRLGIPFVRLGRAVRYRIADLDAWLAERACK